VSGGARKSAAPRGFCELLRYISGRGGDL